MKKIMSKNITKKLLILIIIVILFNFIVPNYSHADFGGALFDPLFDLFATIADAALAALQIFMYDGGEGIDFFQLTVPNRIFKASDYGMEVDYGGEKEEDYIKNHKDEITAVNQDLLDETGWWTYFTTSLDFRNNILLGGLHLITNADQIALETEIKLSPYSIPVIRYSPKTIFSNEVPALDINFINPKIWYTSNQVVGSTIPINQPDQAKNERSVTQILHSTIANWYVALRNLAIVALLSVLLYVGIRMVISASTTEKSKYKQMLKDWVVALCILFFLHYLMSFILTFTETITNGINKSTGDIVVGIYTDDTSGTLVTNMNGEPLIYKTDLMGLCRLKIQSKDISAKLVYLIFYIALVIYTFMFTWTYVKRAITMAFLTLIAPVVAITYPIDKIKDGQAKAFNMWLKEYIFNALLQPFHLIIYTIFLGSSMEIAIKNPIFAILFLAFITPAEKILRSMFGFEKSSTAGGMSTAASLFGGAAVLKGISGLTGKIGAKGANNNKESKGKDNIRTKDKVTDSSAPGLGDAFAGGPELGPTSPEGGQGRGGVTRFTLGNRRAGASNPTNAQPVTSQQTQQRAQALNQGRRYTVQSRTQGPSRVNRGTQYTRPVNNGNTVRTMANRSLTPSARRTQSHRAKGILGATGHVLGGIGKFAGRNAVKGLGLAAGAVIGAAAGIAGGDLEDVLTSTVTGAGIGGMAAPALGRAAVNTAKQIPGVVNDIRDSYEENAYGIEEAQLRQQERELMSDELYEERVSKSLEKEAPDGNVSKEEVRTAMLVGAEYNNAGVTDQKDIIKGMKMEREIRNDMRARMPDSVSDEEIDKMARARSIAITKTASGLTPDYLRKPENQKDLKQSFINQGLSESDASDVLARIKKMKKV